MPRRNCVAKFCGFKYSALCGISLFKFPRNKILFDEWALRCGREDINYAMSHLNNSSQWPCLCEFHFQSFDIRVLANKKVLKPNVLPHTNVISRTNALTIGNSLSRSDSNLSAEIKEDNLNEEIAYECSKEKEKNLEIEIKEEIEVKEETFLFGREEEDKFMVADLPEIKVETEITDPLHIDELEEPFYVDVVDDPLFSERVGEEGSCEELTLTLSSDLTKISNGSSSKQVFMKNLKFSFDIGKESLKNVPSTNSTNLHSQEYIIQENCMKIKNKIKQLEMPPSYQTTLTCEICNLSFESINCLNNHKLSHLRLFYVCLICGKSYMRKCELEAHKITHSNERPFKCEICEKAFKRKSELRVHTQSHFNLKPLLCETCGNSFKSENELREHAKSHCNELLLACNMCRKPFKSKRNLIFHKLSHSVDRPFTCEICNKSFNEKETLRSHILVHINKKSFLCQICGKSFKTKVILKRHSVIHSD